MLNTDLHFAEIESKMTRNQFVKNTLPLVQRMAAEVPPQENLSANSSNGGTSAPVSRSPSLMPIPSQGVPANSKSEANLDTLNVLCSQPAPANTTTHSAGLTPDKAQSSSHRGSWYYNKSWDTQIEGLLRDYYTAIQKQQLPLKGLDNKHNSHCSAPGEGIHLLNNLGGLWRSPSTLSKTGIDNVTRSVRGTDGPTARGAQNSMWGSKGRSKPRLYPPVSMNNRTSMEDQSLWSPGQNSNTWGSKYSLGKTTLNSPSLDSVDSGYPQSTMSSDYQPAVGFANALGHAMAKDGNNDGTETDDNDTNSLDMSGSMLDDDSLELVGAPWIKEGNVKHKHHLTEADKKAKDRNWNECFAVIQRGWLRLFSFDSSNTKASKLRQWTEKHGKDQGNGPVVVGGGNWTESAEQVLQVKLRQTVAAALPKPGYSKSRPYVWALTLPTGAVHLFQVGTEDIVKEFVFTANYWAARLSKEPVQGAISNMEYGWGDKVIKGTQPDEQQSQVPPRSNSAGVWSSKGSRSGLWLRLSIKGLLIM
ncbi:hypothetical protein KEM55_002868 [Ascosphaera atra]|nr:hypothetical protein KEM55_002868 [Ascosphaera atra]